MTSLPLVVLLFLQICSVFSLNEFPNPQKEWRMCGRPKASYVCDPEFILQRGDAEKLDQIAHEFLKSTSCLCPKCSDNVGVSVGIYIKSNISQESASKYPNGKDLSEMLRRRWGLSACEGDIVIVVLTQQNISDFSMGPAVQKIVPQETAQQIMDQCRVHFESGWYYQGLESIVNSFNDVIIRLQRRYTATYKNLIVGVALGFAVLFVLAGAAGILLRRQSKKQRKSCSDIYDNLPQKNRRKPSFTQEQHFEKLKKLTSSDDEEDDDDTSCGQFAFNSKETMPSIHFMGMKRQLSAVTEESQEDIEITKRNSENALSYSFSSSHNSPNRSIPVTEL